VVEAVNFNDPVQTVIAGSKAGGRQGLRSAQGHGRQARAAAAGVGAVPFQPDEAGGREAQGRAGGGRLRRPKIPVVNNIDVAIESDPTASATRCTARPLGRCAGSNASRQDQGRAHTVVECGPGKVLAGMVKRIDADLTGLALYDPATLAEVEGQLG
jgi:[acyl-carrier-protein] S-malonyltransferase